MANRARCSSIAWVLFLGVGFVCCCVVLSLVCGCHPFPPATGPLIVKRCMHSIFAQEARQVIYLCIKALSVRFRSGILTEIVAFAYVYNIRVGACRRIRLAQRWQLSFAYFLDLTWGSNFTL